MTDLLNISGRKIKTFYDDCIECGGVVVSLGVDIVPTEKRRHETHFYRICIACRTVFSHLCLPMKATKKRIKKQK